MSDTAPKGNVKNPAIRRIHADIRELQKDPSDQYHAAPLEENLFEWHFTLRGPPSTDYANGVYHGRILLPSEYPFKPPNIMLLTPNGRFEVGKKICLSISAHHPEHWQPAWGVRLILEALISFFPTEPKGAVGSLDWTPEERKRLALESQSWSCPRCGLAHALLPPLHSSNTGTDAAQEGEGGGGGEGATSSTHPPPPVNKYAEEIAQLYVRGASASVGSEAEAGEGGGGGGGGGREGSVDAAAAGGDEGVPRPRLNAASSTSVAALTEEDGLRRRVVTTTTHPLPPSSSSVAAATQELEEEEEEEEEEDKLFYLAVCLFLLLVLLVGRKVARAWDGAAGPAYMRGGGMSGGWGEGGGGGEEENMMLYD